MTLEQFGLLLSIVSLIVGLLFKIVPPIYRRIFGKEHISVRTTFGYRVDPTRDVVLFPDDFRQENPTRGERCLRITVEYTGKNETAIQGILLCLYGNYQSILKIPPVTLKDGQKHNRLVPQRVINLPDVTAVVVVTKPQGQIIKRVQILARLRWWWTMRKLRP